ncbi:hypothetical protein MHBO_004197 [Bonamia ostreae]|uniref:Uncharacterized protein n=1 Tax=Bonamia ostreae TaxID=126728 RepID=A0ABV2ASW7_9EUKA
MKKQQQVNNDDKTTTIGEDNDESDSFWSNLEISDEDNSLINLTDKKAKEAKKEIDKQIQKTTQNVTLFKIKIKFENNIIAIKTENIDKTDSVIDIAREKTAKKADKGKDGLNKENQQTPTFESIKERCERALRKVFENKINKATKTIINFE